MRPPKRREHIRSGERDQGPALRLLILGGTTQASGLAGALAGRSDVAPLMSFAGRTARPVLPPIPHRVGGFGGVEGLAAFLRTEATDAVIDATHPFAARMSANAVAACRQAGVPLARYDRPPWMSIEGDEWHHVPDIDAAVSALGSVNRSRDPRTVLMPSPRGETPTGSATPHTQERGGIVRPSTRPLRGRLRMMEGEEEGLRVFLTTGRLDLARFRAAPQHRYLVRTIDPPDPFQIPPNAIVVLARPPFTVEDEIALLRAHAIDVLVTKNSGGTASAAKLAAARVLRLPVLMIDRPPASGAVVLQSLDAVLAWIADLHTRA